MKILGISAYYHDSAACLIDNGKIICAAQEERFSRVKHDPAFPVNAINFCIKFSRIKSTEIDYIVFYDKPFVKFERIFETYLSFAPRGFKSFISSFPLWIKDKLFQKKNILDQLHNILGDKPDWEKKLLFSEHHFSHAASAFFPSPFENSAIITMDGVGEWATSSIAIGENNNLFLKNEINFPHSLGLLYSSFTYYAGFKVNSGEYKLMGLAPYGTPKFTSLIKDNLIDIKEDGSFFINMEYFNYGTGLTMTSGKFNHLFGGPPRIPESLLTQKEMDLAASIQKVTEEIILKISKDISIRTRQKNLCLAGGVALNCVANGKLQKSNFFENIWIQPASGDAGGSIGAALGLYYSVFRRPRQINKKDSMKGAFLGPNFKSTEIRSQLLKSKAIFYELTTNTIIKETARLLASGKIIGWFNGRMEFGPRALGGRSIIADPRMPTMQKDLNLKIKYRESFRPFAPSILKEDVSRWFETNQESPYMLFVSSIKKIKRKKNNTKDSLFGIELLNQPRSSVPAITHVDFSARVQTVDKIRNSRFYSLITEFKKITGCPILINTSFNVRGEPLVCNPKDAFDCFMGTDLDVLVIDNFILYKTEQTEKKNSSYQQKYHLD